MMMEKLTMCRICLVENVRMYIVADSQLQEIYEKLTHIQFITEDSRPMLACFFCYARLKQCHRFMMKCLEAEELFAQMLDENYEQKPLKEGVLELFGGFIKTSVQLINIVDLDYETQKVTDLDDLPVSGPIEDQVDLKEEDHSDGFEPNTLDECYPELEGNNHEQSDSEDDVPLIKVKTEMEVVAIPKKRTREKHKRRIALKQGRKVDAQRIHLTKEQQKADLFARSKTSNYINCPYKCDLCYKGFVDLKAYENHKIKHDERSGAYMCDVCRMHYRSLQHLRTHSINAHSRIFKCNKCGHVSHTANQSRVHEKWHNGHIYECKLCSHTFKKPTSYLTHMRKRHPTEHVCNMCGESFVGKHGLQMHKTKTHGIEEKKEVPDDPESPASDRYCSECNIQFLNLEAWKRHILCSSKHTLKNEHGSQCKICKWRCLGNVSLATHLKEHAKSLRPTKKQVVLTDDRRLRCQQCGANFVTRSKLQSHVNKTHLRLKYDKNIVCEICGKKFTSNATLKYHQRMHTGEKPYPCTTCPKRFSDRNKLVIHTRTHTGERPYVCGTCGRSFSQKPALNRHYRVHTGAKPYTCQYCSRTFSQSNAVKLHINTVHLKQPTKKRNRTRNSTRETKNITKNEQELQTV